VFGAGGSERGFALPRNLVGRVNHASPEERALYHMACRNPWAIFNKIALAPQRETESHGLGLHMKSTVVVAEVVRPLPNVGINLGLLFGGFLVGVCLVFLGRKIIRRHSWHGYPHLLVLIDAALVVTGTIVTSALDLWRKQVWTTFDVYAASGYVVMGMVLAIGVGSKVLLSVAKEISASRITELTAKKLAAERERDIALNAEALVCEVMKAKLGRLAARVRTGEGTLEAALDPRKQIHVLIQVLHGHFSKYLKIGHRLRIGIYMPGDDTVTLDAAYSWDGAKTDCFSHKHGDFMKLTSPGGGRSVVVECWLSNEPFQFVADGENAQRAGKFRYFYAGQEKELRSMAAYRHNLGGLSAIDAFVITLDTNQPGLFATDVEAECRLLLPAFSRRIELELLALAATQTSSNAPHL
jgi:hypothetical protein